MSNQIYLRVTCEKTGNTKTLEFNDELHVSETYEKLNEKFEIKTDEKFMLYRPLKKSYLSPSKTLHTYEFANEEMLIYRSPIRTQKVKMMDSTTKSLSVNDSEPISNIIDMLLDQIKINHDSKEEYGFIKEDLEAENKKKNDKNAPKYACLISTCKWLDPTQTLCYEEIDANDVLILKKRLFFTDERLNRNDNVQVNLVYNQVKDSIINGVNPCTLDEALQLAAIQCRVLYGDCEPEKLKSILNIDECLPPDYRKTKKVEKLIIDEYMKLKGLNELNGKFKYIQVCRSLKTYGTTFFLVKEKNPKKKNKPIPILLGVTKSSVIRVNPDTKEVMDEWKLVHLKRWTFNSTSFTIDFGAYKDTNYIVETDQGFNIANLMNDYIKLLFKTKNKDDKKEEEEEVSEEFAQVTEVENPRASFQPKPELSFRKSNVNDYIDILNTALMYIGKAEECIIQSVDDTSIYSDKTYFQNYKSISTDIDTTHDNIKKLGPLSKEDDLEGICSKILTVASTIEELITLVVFNSLYLTNNNLTKNPKSFNRESSLLIKNYYFKGNKDLKPSSLYSIPDNASICSSVKSGDSIPRDNYSVRSFDLKSVDIKNITNSEGYKLVAEKIFLPEGYKVVMHSKYIIESLKEAIISNNDSQRYTILSIDTRVIIELLSKLKISIYENIPGKADCNAFIKKITEVRKNFTQLQESINNETISIDNDDDDFNPTKIEERYIDIINGIEKYINSIYDLSKENYINMINDLRQLHEQFNEVYEYSYKICVYEYKNMKASSYLKKYLVFLNVLLLYVNDLKKMRGDYRNLAVEECEAFDNNYNELQSLIDLLRTIPKPDIKEEKKEVVETLNFYNEILSDSDLARLNKLIEILNNCPNVSDIQPNENTNYKNNIIKLKTLSNFMVIMCNCMIDIYKFYCNLNVPVDSNDSSEEDNENNNTTCDVDYDKKDKVILFDILENQTFKYSDIIIELADMLNSDAFQHTSGNLTINESELYTKEIKKNLLQVIENEKKIINNEEKHQNVWNNSINQLDRIQSIIFSLLSQLPTSDNEKLNSIYIIYNLQSIIRDLDENIILSDGALLNPLHKSFDFIPNHHKRIQREYEALCNSFKDLIETDLTDKPLLGLIIKTVHIFELFILMLKISVCSMTSLSKENQKSILDTAKATAIALNKVVLDKLGLTEEDEEDILLYVDDLDDYSKFDSRINISEDIKEEYVDAFNTNMEVLKEKINSTMDVKTILFDNVNSAYQNINDVIEIVRASECQKYTIDIGDFENVCNVFDQIVTDISSNYNEYNNQMKIFKIYEYFAAFEVFSHKIISINTENDSLMGETKEEMLKIYNTISQINIKLKVDIISLMEEGREDINSSYEPILQDVTNVIKKTQELCKKAKETQNNVYTSPKNQKLNSMGKYCESIVRNNEKELDILNNMEFYNFDPNNLIYYVISNTLCSVHVNVYSLMNKCEELFNLSCNSPMEGQMYKFDDNWCDLMISSFVEVNETIKNLSNIIHKNATYMKNKNIHQILKKLRETLFRLNYLSTKKYMLNNKKELLSTTAGENAIRSIEIAMTFMGVEGAMHKLKYNMLYVYMFYISIVLFIIFSLFN